MRLLTHNQLCCITKACREGHKGSSSASTSAAAAAAAAAPSSSSATSSSTVAKASFPLRIAATKVEQTQTEFDAEFMLSLFAKVDYVALYHTAVNDLGFQGLPDPSAIPHELNMAEHGQLLQMLHTLLLDTHITDGALICNACGRSYPIQSGVPNMRLNEDEV